MRLKLLVLNVFITLSLLSCLDNKPIYDTQISDLETLEVFDTYLIPDNFKDSDLLLGYKSIQEFRVTIGALNIEEILIAEAINPDKAKELCKSLFYYNIRVQSDEKTYNKFKTKGKLSKSDIKELLSLPSKGAVYNSFLDEKGNYVDIDFPVNHQSRTYSTVFDDIRSRKMYTDMVHAYNFGMLENGMVDINRNPGVKKSYDKFKAFMNKYDDYAKRMKVGVDIEHLFFGYAGFTIN